MIICSMPGNGVPVNFPMQVNQPSKSVRFRVALSFPGEYRTRVENIAEGLAASLSREKVLYDQWYAAEFARPNLDAYLPKLYFEQSQLLVFFLCKAYCDKEWCGLEWRAGRALLKQGDDDRLMFLRVDAADIPGLYSIDGFLDIGVMPDNEVVAAILERLRILETLTFTGSRSLVRNGDGDSSPANDKNAGPEPSRLRVAITLICTLEQFKEVAEAAEEFLRKASGDARLTIKRMKSGSTIIIVDCSMAGFERLKSLIERGELIDVAGYRLKTISSDSDSECEMTWLSEQHPSLFDNSPGFSGVVLRIAVPRQFYQLGILVIDGSGSMTEPTVGGISKAQATSNSIGEFLSRVKASRLARNFVLSIISFDEKPIVRLEPTMAGPDLDDSGDYNPLRGHGGGTRIYAALEMAAGIARDFISGASHDRTPRNAVLMVMSDGCCKEPDKTRMIATQIKDGKFGSHVRICTTFFATLGIRDLESEGLLREIASDAVMDFRTSYDKETLRTFFVQSLVASSGVTL